MFELKFCSWRSNRFKLKCVKPVKGLEGPSCDKLQFTEFSYARKIQKRFVFQEWSNIKSRRVIPPKQKRKTFLCFSILTNSNLGTAVNSGYVTVHAVSTLMLVLTSSDSHEFLCHSTFYRCQIELCVRFSWKPSFYIQKF